MLSAVLVILCMSIFLAPVHSFAQVSRSDPPNPSDQSDQSNQSNQSNAVATDNRFDLAKLAEGSEQIAEFQAAHATQPGYRGSITVDAGNGQHLTITLWQSEPSAAAARAALESVVKRLLVPPASSGGLCMSRSRCLSTWRAAKRCWISFKMTKFLRRSFQ